ncbi:hypothetical protein STCU_01723 [Strigomonas culicis]|uniref:Uncharacterized protein n=1 Tax=Strigomonas culicis TaxID=28005 RepID=S9UZP1_9TRYP|nr:hypothetical protein STCU_05984 [Strigomonas culicis]EPY34248.1 hypothetical protein STCU_01723 [Strigomonas culicis]|eukprot:EPY26976.1 hypothetical protein STCU_05984 [Strigomonas culicis]
MESAKLIDFSLTKTRIEKLVVCIGFSDYRSLHSRASVPCRVSQLLLRQCRVPPNDVHDPDKTRLHARDKSGSPRAHYSAVDRQAAGGRRSRGRDSTALRRPQTWDSEKVPDFMGVWCDRLLLGHVDAPSRTALLEPHVPLAFQGEALERVLRAHRYVAPKDVLLVSATPMLPFGVVRLSAAGRQGGLRLCDAAPSPAGASFASLAEVLRRTARANAPPHATLWLGVGGEMGPQSPFTAAEEDRLRTLLVPLAAFGSALWTVNPTKSAEYVASLTKEADSLTYKNANLRLWKMMQASMLSTRDCALLRSQLTGDPLDARLGAQQRDYFAQTLLQRLKDGDQ